MEYTLSEVNDKIQEFADKLDSDYFTLPVILDHFETATYDFIDEHLKEVEKTQHVTDAIRSLVIPGSLAIIKDPLDTTRYIAALPVNYHRLISYDVIYSDNTRCRRADLKKHSEYYPNLNNPNQKPTKYYPVILQENNMFQIDCGNKAVPKTLKAHYCKLPTFATPTQANTRIVNLPNDSIEKILLSTVTRLFNTTGDQRTQSNYQLQESFAKILR
jgi:hypothetical protein